MPPTAGQGQAQLRLCGCARLNKGLSGAGQEFRANQPRSAPWARFRRAAAGTARTLNVLYTYSTRTLHASQQPQAKPAKCNASLRSAPRSTSPHPRPTSPRLTSPHLSSPRYRSPQLSPAPHPIPSSLRTPSQFEPATPMCGGRRARGRGVSKESPLLGGTL